MKVLIFEDEKPTAKRLTQLLKEIDAQIQVLDVLSSVKAGVEWYKNNPMPDLIFQDIQLNDGNCFEIFQSVEVSAPVIFTTAFSDYAIQSFQVNSIDYIVKPYDKNEIEKAIHKFRNLKESFLLPEHQLLKEVVSKRSVTAKKRFLVKVGDNYKTINASEIAYILSEEGLCFIHLYNQKKHIVDYSIVELSNLMDENEFFQINRQLILNIESISKITSWFNSRLKIEINVPIELDIVVSRERVKNFKAWLDR